MLGLSRHVLLSRVTLSLVLLFSHVFINMASAQEDYSLRLDLKLPKQQYRSWEEIIPRVTITNVSANDKEICLPATAGPWDVRLLNAETNEPFPKRREAGVRSVHDGPNSRQYLRFKKALPPDDPKMEKIKPAGDNPTNSLWHHSDCILPGKRASEPYSGGIRLLPGQSVQLDFRLTEDSWLYLGLPEGKYILTALCVIEGVTVTSQTLPFSVVGKSEIDQEELNFWAKVDLAAPEKKIEQGKAFLRSYPNSTFENRVNKGMLQAAETIEDWPSVARVAEELYKDTVHLTMAQRDNALSMWAMALWKMKKDKEAEELVLREMPNGKWVVAEVKKKKAAAEKLAEKQKSDTM